jgi:peptidoglycan/xylan/chitin deacetylase (PgdA/CDA1 family)
MRVVAKLLVLALLLLAGTAPATAQEGKRIALSFDDVPRQPGGFMTPDQRTLALITGLEQAGVEQAAFFVTPGNLEKDFGQGGEERIEAYAAAGHVIGNHSYSHTWLSRSTVVDYVADLDRAEAWLADKPGKRPWYRFPYLDEGRDIERRDALRAALAERGLRNGYVTVDNYDWAIDDLARKAMADGTPIDLPALRTLYVETVVQTADFNEAIAREVLGRSPAHVILLHETDLNALFIGDIVAGLRADGWTIVTMDEAYSDPIARLEPDTLFLGGGRIAALAAAAGREPDSLVYERTDKAELARLFEERVVRKGGR